jgi:hypothetical protein
MGIKPTGTSENVSLSYFIEKKGSRKITKIRKMKKKEQKLFNYLYNL